MASAEHVERTVHDLMQRFQDLDPTLRSSYSLDRTVSCTVTDLDQVWSGRLCDEGLLDVSIDGADKAQVRLAVSSDDLVALAEGRLSVASAFATGRLRVQAAPLDLLKLRTLL